MREAVRKHRGPAMARGYEPDQIIAFLRGIVDALRDFFERILGVLRFLSGDDET